MKKGTLTYHLVACVVEFASKPGGTGRAQGASDQNVDLARFLPNHGNSVRWRARHPRAVSILGRRTDLGKMTGII